MKCETCRFWFADDPGTAECRRRAPVALGKQTTAGRAIGFWPETPSWGWCGEYRIVEPADGEAATPNYPWCCNRYGHLAIDGKCPICDSEIG